MSIGSRLLADKRTPLGCKIVFRTLKKIAAYKDADTRHHSLKPLVCAQMKVRGHGSMCARAESVGVSVLQTRPFSVTFCVCSKVRTRCVIMLLITSSSLPGARSQW